MPTPSIASPISVEGANRYASVAKPVTTASVKPDAAAATKPVDTTVVDPTTLKGDDKAYYDVWQASHKNTPFTLADLKQIGYEQDAGDLNFYKAKQTGLILDKVYKDEKSGKEYHYSVVTPEAIATMGGKFTASGTDSGKIYILPTGTPGVHNSTFQKVTDYTEGELAGYTQYGATGNRDSGFSFVGNVFGQGAEDLIDNAIPNEVKFAMDPLGIQGSMMYGKSFNRDATHSVAKRFGLNDSEVATAQMVGKAVVQAVATVLAPPVALGIEASSQMNQVAQGNQKFGAALANAAIFAAGVVSGNPYVSVGLQAGYSLAKGEDKQKVFKDAAWSAAGAYAGGGNRYGTVAVNALRTQVDPDYSNLEFAVNTIGSLASQTAQTGKRPGKPTMTWDSKGANSTFTRDVINWDAIPDRVLRADKAPMDDLHSYPAPAKGGPSGKARRPPYVPKARTFEDLLVSFSPETYQNV